MMLRVDIEVRGEVPVDAEAVWRAWEDPRELTAWWSPGGTTVTSASVELRAGGRIGVTSRGRGATFEVSGVVEAANRPAGFTTTWVWQQADPGIARQPTVVDVSCTPSARGTLVTVRQTGFATQLAADRNAEGWQRALEGLAEHLGGR